MREDYHRTMWVCFHTDSLAPRLLYQLFILWRKAGEVFYKTELFAVCKCEQFSWKGICKIQTPHENCQYFIQIYWNFLILYETYHYIWELFMRICTRHDKKCPKNWFLLVNLYRVPNLSATPYSCLSFLYFAFHMITTCLREWWSVPYHGGISSTVSLFLTICCFTAHELFVGFHSQQCVRSQRCPDGSSSRDHGNVWTMGGLIGFVILPFRIHPSSLR